MVRLMLVLALVLSLAACGGSRTDGLSKTEEQDLETRLEAAEAARAQAEAEKAEAEAARAQAEVEEARAEAARAQAEAEKAAAEAARAQAEVEKAEAEAARAQAEAEKAEAEAARAQAEVEEARAEDERAQAEALRAEAEAAAAEAEAARAEAEAARAEAEDARAQAEAAQAIAEAAQARAEAEVQHQLREAQTAREEAQTAREEAQTAREEAQTAREEAQTARGETETAEQAQERLADEAEEARQEALQAESSVALAGLGAEVPLPDPDVDATYNAPAALVATPPAGQPGVTFTSPRGSSARDGWYATRADSQGQTTQDTIVVYSDVRRTVQVAIDQHTVYNEVFGEANDKGFYDFTFPTGVRQNNDHKDAIKASRFPTAGRTATPDLKGVVDPQNPDADPASYVLKSEISGTFGGTSGKFQCTATTAKGCSVHHTGAGYDFPTGTWTFTTTSKSPKFDVADENFMYFGWWRRQMTAGALSFSYGTFRDPGVLATGQFIALEGRYTYEGPAIGQYAIYQPLGTQSNHGEFEATARFQANFGTETELGTINGTVSGFEGLPGWSLTLGEIDMAANGTLTSGAVSWTIDNNTHSGGEWSGSFHSEIDPHQDHIPDGLTGKFEALYGPDPTSPVGMLVGAYGAHIK